MIVLGLYYLLSAFTMTTQKANHKTNILRDLADSLDCENKGKEKIGKIYVVPELFSHEFRFVKLNSRAQNGGRVHGEEVFLSEIL